MKSNIITVSGYTNSGKDEVAKYLNNRFGFIKVHPIEDLKEFLEKHYSLPQFSLDTREYKAAKPSTSDYTYQEMMVGLFEFYKKFDPKFSQHYLYTRVRHLINIDENVCTVALRAMHEITTLSKVVAETNSNWVHIHIEREAAIKESSDNGYDEIINYAQIHSDFYTIYNNSDLEYLRKEIFKIVAHRCVIG